MDDKLKFLLESTARLTQERHLGSILIQLADITCELLEADRASIFLHDPSRKELWTVVAHGVEEIRIPDTVGIAGSVHSTGQVIQLDDAYQDARFDPEIDRSTGYRTQTMLAYPLRHQEGHIIGVFQIINKKNSARFNPDDVQLLSHLSLYVSSTLQNAILTEQLMRAQEDAIYRLSWATKYKDPETRNHIVRVGLYAEVMAKCIGWKSTEREMIRLAAPMHDIGKVGIPDAILQKPSNLTGEEWAVMRRHSQYGYDILQSDKSGLMQMASNAALDHHEKWNGTGYPNHKQGHVISMEGRLTAISDVFDALTSKRCYKDAWPYTKTKDLIISESGHHFDPLLVEVFCDVFKEITHIREEYRDEG